MSGKVAILLALHQSQGFLSDLLASLAGQHHEDWTLHASLDGPDDGSSRLIQAFSASQSQRVVLGARPKLGFASNFLDLLAGVGPDADFAAFCDHDDVWLPDKLARAVGSLSQAPSSAPALYASRSIVCDAGLRAIALSPAPDLEHGFHGALRRSIASGNTMVLNRAGINLLQMALLDGGKPAFHDWWTYQIVIGVGGRIIFDPAPSLLYRQHDQNVLGSFVARKGKLRRLRAILNGDHRRWTETQLIALKASRHRLLPGCQEILDEALLKRGGLQSGWRHHLRRNLYQKVNDQRPSQGADLQHPLRVVASFPESGTCHDREHRSTIASPSDARAGAKARHP